MADDDRRNIVDLLRIQADENREWAEAFPWWNWWEPMRWNARAKEAERIAKMIEEKWDWRVKAWSESFLCRSVEAAFQPEGK